MKKTELLFLLILFMDLGCANPRSIAPMPSSNNALAPTPTPSLGEFEIQRNTRITSVDGNVQTLILPNDPKISIDLKYVDGSGASRSSNLLTASAEQQKSYAWDTSNYLGHETNVVFVPEAVQAKVVFDPGIQNQAIKVGDFHVGTISISAANLGDSYFIQVSKNSIGVAYQQLDSTRVESVDQGCSSNKITTSTVGEKVGDLYLKQKSSSTAQMSLDIYLHLTISDALTLQPYSKLIDQQQAPNSCASFCESFQLTAPSCTGSILFPCVGAWSAGSRVQCDQSGNCSYNGTSKTLSSLTGNCIGTGRVVSSFTSIDETDSMQKIQLQLDGLSNSILLVPQEILQSGVEFGGANSDLQVDQSIGTIALE